MEDPEHQITSVLLQLTSSSSADAQKAALDKYFCRDVGFRHPLCYVPPVDESREVLLGIYQWYKVMSPTIDAYVQSVVYDKERNVLLLDVFQTFHIRLSPFKPSQSRLLVRITLKEVDGLHYIAFQEDFYHPDDFMRLLIPPLAPLIRAFLTTASLASTMYAKGAQLLGFWSVRGGSAQSNGGASAGMESDVEHEHEHDDHYHKRGLYDGDKTD
ncbi:hypothetical protein K435DRAFT_675833 [Dendrothele bispora CBS 962.96]|uniref:SigF-like NTF2-like domain-containing protein n=1 Tax=Dendrothele bispora (strain CBS 962.96) TaxID=1314807 RepID=A0A4S8LMN2_DENBC|nr:hypothetical protein K435DRAFT_675833 [Dendrothele bispora CBS 962.96]